MAIVHEITMESLDAYIEGQNRIQDARVSKTELPVMLVTAGDTPEVVKSDEGETLTPKKKTRKPKSAPVSE